MTFVDLAIERKLSGVPGNQIQHGRPWQPNTTQASLATKYNTNQEIDETDYV